MPTSILGDESQYYQSKTSQGGHILDNPALGILEFYPAGYTKPGSTGDRQDLYRALFDIATRWGKDDQQYPFGKDDCEILLLSDPTNKFDPNAIKVMMNLKNKLRKKWIELGHPCINNLLDLGFVPMKISKMMTKNIKMIGKSTILKVRMNVHGKYYSAKVVMKYGQGGIAAVDQNNTRFYALLDE